MKVRILGCGTSTGVPRIGNDWGQCDPAEPRHHRLRSSIWVESAGERMLVGRKTTDRCRVEDGLNVTVKLDDARRVTSVEVSEFRIPL